MKTFRQLVAEVAEPRGGDERRFKQMHVDAIEVVDYPIPGNDHVFKGTIQHPGRLADIADPDDEHYDQTYKDHGDAGIVSRFDDDEEDEEADEEISKRVAKRRQQLAVDEETQLDENRFISKSNSSQDHSYHHYDLASDHEEMAKKHRALGGRTHEAAAKQHDLAAKAHTNAAQHHEDNALSRASSQDKKNAMDASRAAASRSSTAYKTSHTMNVKEETQLDELKKSTLASYVKKASTDQYLKGQAVQYHTNKANDSKGSAFEKESKKKHLDAADKALRKASNRDTGIGRAVDRLAKEETIIEAVRPGSVKLSDGSIQKITKEDADVLNSLFTQLNSANRAKMESRLTSGKKGFTEVLEFAKNV